MKQISVYPAESSLANAARRQADRLGLNYEDSRPRDYALRLSLDGLSLMAPERTGFGPILCDFAAGSADHRRRFGGGKGQAIARAVGVSSKFHPHILDATAGMGGDAFVFASLGCSVTMLERNTVVFALLEDGITRLCALRDRRPELNPVVERMRLINDDAARYLISPGNENKFDVIYIDPMFPESTGSARVGKEMQAFQEIVGKDSDAAELLPLALKTARYRVVVKRPRLADYLGGIVSGYSLNGKSTRFDVYALRKLPA